MIKITQKGNFSKLERYLKKATPEIKDNILHRYGQEGVLALASVTPTDSGETARSWYYEIEKGKEKISIVFKNSNIQNGVPIAIILQYGHGTRNGGYVEGRDYINPAMRPIFDRLANSVWREVSHV